MGKYMHKIKKIKYKWEILWGIQYAKYAVCQGVFWVHLKYQVVKEETPIWSKNLNNYLSSVTAEKKLLSHTNSKYPTSLFKYRT